MVAETWEVAMRRVIRESGTGLSAGYVYDPFDGGYAPYHNKDAISVHSETEGAILAIGYFKYGRPSVSIYGREYIKDIENLAAYIEEELGFKYKPILRKEQPEITRVKGPRGFLQERFFPYLYLWVMGCLCASVFAWIAVMFCYCFIRVLMRGG